MLFDGSVACLFETHCRNVTEATMLWCDEMIASFMDFKSLFNKKFFCNTTHILFVFDVDTEYSLELLDVDRRHLVDCDCDASWVRDKIKQKPWLMSREVNIWSYCLCFAYRCVRSLLTAMWPTCHGCRTAQCDRTCVWCDVTFDVEIKH